MPDSLCWHLWQILEVGYESCSKILGLKLQSAKTGELHWPHGHRWHSEELKDVSELQRVQSEGAPGSEMPGMDELQFGLSLGKLGLLLDLPDPNSSHPNTYVWERVWKRVKGSQGGNCCWYSYKRGRGGSGDHHQLLGVHLRSVDWGRLGWGPAVGSAVVWAENFSPGPFGVPGTRGELCYFLSLPSKYRIVAG